MFPLLFAAEQVAHVPWFKAWWGILLMLIGALVASYSIGNFVAKRVRMKDYGWKIGLMLASVSWGIIIVVCGWPPRFGVDLRGGVTLIYKIAEPETAPGARAEKPKAGVLATLLQDRVDPSGTKEVVIRPYGNDRIEITVPDVGTEEVENIKRRVTQAGYLQFRIVANTKDHADIIERARDLSQQGNKFVVDEAGNAIGKWVGVKKDTEPRDGRRRFKTTVWSDVIRDAKTKEEIKIPPRDISQLRSGEYRFGPRRVPFEEYLLHDYVRKDGTKGGIADVEVLMATNDGINLEGSHLASVRSSFDNTARPCINFNPTARGAILFGALTGDNMPDKRTGFARRMGIVLDGELYSAPNIRGVITSQGQITGSFTQEEVDFLVSILRAGKLPAALEKQPLSEDRIDSHLGLEMRERGIYAIGFSLLMVILFMVAYYRFSGVVACLALLTNLVCIVAVIILVKQPFSLTGLAGLVLTVGMSVDANVLIFERLREELDRGSTLRMAIRNGFARATTTIVDANLTTLITAIVLYAIGTEQIRGFAVALILGILMSMYTAIFCARVIFDIAERRRWITKLQMLRLIGATQFDFIGKRMVVTTTSVVLIVIGLLAVVYRGKGIYAIDLSGGTSVRVVLTKPVEPDEVRRRMKRTLETWDNGKPLRVNGARVSYTVTPMWPKDLPPQTVYKIDSSIPELEPTKTKSGKTKSNPAKQPPDLADVIKKAFQNGSKTLLAMNRLEFDPLRVVPPEAGEPSEGQAPGGAPPEEQESATGGSTDQESGSRAGSTDRGVDPGKARPQTGDPQSALPRRSVFALARAAGDSIARSDEEPARPQAETPRADSPQEDGKQAPRADRPEGGQKAADHAPPAASSGQALPAPGGEPSDEAASQTESETPIQRVWVQTKLQFGYAIEQEALKEKILNTAGELKIAYLSDSEIKLKHLDPPPDNTPGFKTWELQIKATRADAQSLLRQLKTEYDHKPYFRGESGVGSQIAGNTQMRAMGALMASLLGIIIYIWIRFQKVVFGLAAVVALIHDVLFVLGAIAVSFWFQSALGFLGIEEFKISLPVVAAFLTIIGYSLNDTIVVFDRIREVRGKSPELTEEMINKSIGQTLSRTLLTSLTTLLVVVVLYAGGGEAIHGFAFALVVGVVVGTYSSIFVASPALLWMVGSEKRAKARRAA